MSKRKENQTGDKNQYQMTNIALLGVEMGKVSFPIMSEETKGSIHVLHQVGDLLLAHLGPQVTFLQLSSRTQKSQKT